MKNVLGRLLTAWFELLSGNISVPVYRTDAPPEEEGNYVLLRAESDTDNSNNQNFVTNPVIITEVITKFAVRIDDGLAPDIDDEIGVLLKTNSATHNLPAQPGIAVIDVRRTNSTILNEDDGDRRINRLITRNIHRVLQTN